MSFWTVEDAGPYKEKSNFLMRRSLYSLFFLINNKNCASLYGRRTGGFSISSSW